MREVYLIQWEQPRLVIDITDTMDLTREAICCYASQAGDVKAGETRMRNRAAPIGKEAEIRFERAAQEDKSLEAAW